MNSSPFFLTQRDSCRPQEPPSSTERTIRSASSAVSGATDGFFPEDGAGNIVDGEAGQLEVGRVDQIVGQDAAALDQDQRARGEWSAPTRRSAERRARHLLFGVLSRGDVSPPEMSTRSPGRSVTRQSRRTRRRSRRPSGSRAGRGRGVRSPCGLRRGWLGGKTSQRRSRGSRHRRRSRWRSRVPC